MMTEDRELIRYNEQDFKGWPETTEEHEAFWRKSNPGYPKRIESSTDPIEIVVLTKNNISAVAKRLDKPESELFETLSEANAQNKICYVAFDLVYIPVERSDDV